MYLVYPSAFLRLGSFVHLLIYSGHVVLSLSRLLYLFICGTRTYTYTLYLFVFYRYLPLSIQVVCIVHF
ncbi:hypothetical protein BDP27DRAFT_1325670 [Rhodocollybia butyracea]|uniref:Uncharacterized protein n=1 Tax=Rhodocollybia butyracea TaxID=206335 RepID=A0A9P5U7S1_9AGAR|nr:hypothetical protein BDP27DRAFT_1325670 [Rhodocollybia butyracea]